MSAATKDAPGREAIKCCADFVKYTVAFSVGSLVFSIALIDKLDRLDWFSAIAILCSWLLLSISVICGVLAYSRIPVMLAEENYDLEDSYFNVPGKIHQISFIIGVVLIGVALFSGLITTVWPGNAHLESRPHNDQAHILIYRGAEMLNAAVVSLNGTADDMRYDIDRASREREHFDSKLSRFMNAQNAKWARVRRDLIGLREQLQE